MQIDSEIVKGACMDVFQEYIDQRLSELLSTERGGSRIKTEQIQGLLGKMQAATDLKAKIANAISRE